MEFHNPEEVYAFLNRFLNFERKADPKEYRLDRMQKLKELFGRPDEAYRIFHVAGSKGKGSTSTMLAAILRAVGRRTGLYTSPHLLYYTERINIDGEPVKNKILLEAAAELAAGLSVKGPEAFPGGESPTYFELLTMLAFLCFKKAGCEDVVLEVGLGGRLDSTNVVKPFSCLITEIELEHTELLGNSIAQIATEKAGIIKPGIPVFTSSTKPDALRVFKEKAAGTGSEIHVLDDEYKLGELAISKNGSRFVMESLLPPITKTVLATKLIGRVQARNAALAAMAAMAAGHAGCSQDQIKEGLAKAVLRARFEIMDREPPVILDGAHTPDSIKASVDDFATIFPDGGSLLFGCAKDKDVNAMAGILGQVFSEAIITRPGTFKESDTAAMIAAFSKAGLDTKLVENTEEAVKTAVKLAQNMQKPLLIIGSFYLCAAAAAILL
ncbi:folylpolyglutamate synthase/dihydrofolate synthase family protein [Spirochaetota bacterium]